jgi:hypothetical protein
MVGVAKLARDNRHHYPHAFTYSSEAKSQREGHDKIHKNPEMRGRIGTFSKD